MVLRKNNYTALTEVTLALVDLATTNPLPLHLYLAPHIAATYDVYTEWD